MKNGLNIRIKLVFFLQPKLSFLYKVLNKLGLGKMGAILIRFLNKFRVSLADYVLDDVCKKTDYWKRMQCLRPSGHTIGNIVWMFWTSGYENAPPVVKKCIDRVRSFSDTNLILLTDKNISEYVPIYEDLKKKQASGILLVQHVSDIVRCYLLSHFGGCWADATILPIDRKYFARIRDLDFYTIKHSHSNFFNDGKFSTFLIASGEANLFMVMAYELWQAYLCYYKPFDYFLTDFMWYYLYRKSPLVKEMIDGVPISEDIFDISDLAKIRDAEFDEERFIARLKRNSIQKLNYKDARTRRALKNSKSVYSHILSVSNDEMNAIK